MQRSWKPRERNPLGLGSMPLIHGLMQSRLGQSFIQSVSDSASASSGSEDPARGGGKIKVMIYNGDVLFGAPYGSKISPLPGDFELGLIFAHALPRGGIARSRP